MTITRVSVESRSNYSTVEISHVNGEYDVDILNSNVTISDVQDHINEKYGLNVGPQLIYFE